MTDFEKQALKVLADINHHFALIQKDVAALRKSEEQKTADALKARRLAATRTPAD
jgi:hypothetical protein